MRETVTEKRRPKRNTHRKILMILWLLVFAAIFVIGKDCGSMLLSGALEVFGYPESLIELQERYPQTRSFVLRYPLNKNKHDTADLSNEVVQGEIPLFIQWDSRWGYERYGDDFLAVTGCGPTCLSMVYSGLSGQTDQDPYKVAEMAERMGYYVSGVGTDWGLMQAGAGELGLSAKQISVDEASLLENLAQEKPIICSVRPGDFTSAGHFIVLTGISGDGQIQVNDPNSRTNSERTWALQRLLPQIRSAWAYEYVG